ncbi:Hypothetical protein D9617_25g061910 [Elsinoe fawcettii]|nr:Hypothetical protein D9617_25g061910 [Elsinoe fawcettii]
MVYFKPFIIFPLYLWPGPNAWKPLYEQIDKYPNVNFNIIINPNSGPGTTGGAPPAQTWIDAIAKLNAKPNTQLLGYTHVLWGNRTLASVRADINAYASWSNYKGANIGLDGIFFDESPSSTSPQLISYMKTLSTTARNKLSSPNKRIVFNPGVAVGKEYYALADTIVGFENYYSAFAINSSGFPINTVKAGTKAKTAFIIQGFSGTAQQQKQIVTAMTGNNITGIYISTQGSYDKFSKFWPQLVAQVNGVK